MPVAPSAARSAHRRALLKRFAAAVVVALFVAACGAGGDDAGTAGDPVASDGTPIADDVEPDEVVPEDVESGDVESDDVGSGELGSTDVAPPSAPATDTSPAEPPGVQPEGFTVGTVRITEPDGEVCEVCVWLADTADERARGLMGVTDLGGAAGMLFVFEQPISTSFYMFQTPRPLSIAWFGADGTYVAQTEMTPCLDDSSDACARYAPGDEYLTALEVWSGDLPAIGVGPGSTLELVSTSEATSCATL